MAAIAYPKTKIRVNATCRKCPHKVHRMEMKTAISCTILRHTKILIALFFLNVTATTEIYTLSLHDALPISTTAAPTSRPACSWRWSGTRARRESSSRSEEHTSELQSRQYLVCRLLLEK